MSWDQVPLGYCVTEVKEKNAGGREDNLLSLSYGNIVRRDIATADGLLPESFDSYNVINPGDTVLRLTDLQNDQRSLRVGLVEEVGIITSAYVTIRPSKVFHPKFLNYFLKHMDFRKDFYALGAGVRQSLKFEELRLVKVPIPALADQKAIAEYLDGETARVDALIERKQRMVNLLLERQGLVPEGLLTNLRNNAGLVALKHLVCESDERSGDKIDRVLLSVSIHYGVVPRAEAFEKESRADDFSNYKICERGNIVLNRMRAFQGAVGVVDSPGIVSPDYTVMKVGLRLDPTYVHYLMRSHWFIGEMASRIRGIGSADQGQVRTPRVNFADLREILVPVPSLDEQEHLVNSWRTQESSMHDLIERMNRQTSLLREHRQALITAAITGELEITKVAV